MNKRQRKKQELLLELKDMENKLAQQKLQTQELAMALSQLQQYRVALSHQNSTRIFVGKLLASRLRKFLNKEQAERDIEVTETSGWLQNEFSVKGSDFDINYLKTALEGWWVVAT